MLGWIGQTPMIFAGSIEDNIRFARPEASDDELAAALRLARLTDLIAALPGGLRNPDWGRGLWPLRRSGPAHRDCPGVFEGCAAAALDEPTAHLDPAIELRAGEASRA